MVCLMPNSRGHPADVMKKKMDRLLRFRTGGDALLCNRHQVAGKMGDGRKKEDDKAEKDKLRR